MPRTLIIYCGRYPGGAAGAKRVRQFAQGLRLAGDEAHILGYRRGGPADQPNQWELDHFAVPYRTVHIRAGPKRSPLVLMDAMHLFDRLAEAALCAHRDINYDRAILYGHSWLGLHKVTAALSRAGIPMAADMNEWWLWDARRAGTCIDQVLFRRHCLPKIRAILGISSFWEDYARRIGKRCMIVPAMADNEFQALPLPQFAPFNLVYTGFMFRRDLPQTLLQGVRLAIARGFDVHLVIVGKMDAFVEARAAVRRIQSDPELRHRTHITGWIERDELYRIYSRASAFVLLRNDDWETRVSFPTRIPEYLSTGRPVIASRAGDIGRYLVDGCDACLLDPGDHPDQLADVICELMSVPNKAQSIGRGGRQSVAAFSHELHGRRLKEFLDAG